MTARRSLCGNKSPGLQMSRTRAISEGLRRFCAVFSVFLGALMRLLVLGVPSPDETTNVILSSVTLPAKCCARVCMCRDGKLLVAGGENPKVQVFDLETRSVLRTFKQHTAPVVGETMRSLARALSLLDV